MILRLLPPATRRQESMAKVYETIDESIGAWLRQQPMFFVATGLVNCSPKGLDTLRILGPREVAWLDVGGSGIETVAHLKENGRIVIMFCAFEGAPRILRLHGHGVVIERNHPDFKALLATFPPQPVCRAIVRIDVQRISDSCGWGVPMYRFDGQRDDIARAVAGKSREQLLAQAARQNSRSVDGLEGLDLDALE
jgi:hypothetical protein